MTDDTGNSEDVRDLIPGAAFLTCVCAFALLVLVGKIDGLEAGARPSKLATVAVIVIGAALGRLVPLLPSDGPGSGSGPSVGVALLLTSGVAALVGQRDRFPSEPTFVLAFIVGSSAVVAARIIVRQFRKSGAPEAPPPS